PRADRLIACSSGPLARSVRLVAAAPRNASAGSGCRVERSFAKRTNRAKAHRLMQVAENGLGATRKDLPAAQTCRLNKLAQNFAPIEQVLRPPRRIGDCHRA